MAFSRLVPLFALFLAPVLLATEGQASAGEWQSGQYTRARLISAVQATGDLAQLPLGLEITLAGSWKTYWRTPGDSGLPPQFDWSDSQNLAAMQVHYPAPTRFTLFDMQTFGYQNQLILPLTWTSQQPGEAIAASLKLDLLLCDEICIPDTVQLRLDLPEGEATPSPFYAHFIEDARAKLPQSPKESGMTIKHLLLIGLETDRPRVEAVIESETPLQNPDIFIESTPYLPLSAPALFRHDGKTLLRLGFEGDPPPATLFAEAPLPVRVTVTDGERAMEQETELHRAAAMAELGWGLWLPYIIGGLLLLSIFALPFLRRKSVA